MDWGATAPRAFVDGHVGPDQLTSTIDSNSPARTCIVRHLLLMEATAPAAPAAQRLSGRPYRKRHRHQERILPSL